MTRPATPGLPVAEHPRALLDTSAVIDPAAHLTDIAASLTVSTITLAELAFGLHTADPVVNAARELRYQRILETFDPVPYSPTAARLYGALCEIVKRRGRNPRPRRLDLLIASVAAELAVPLVTRNPDDFTGLHPGVHVISLR